MRKTPQPRRTCDCGQALVWHRRSASWVCPEVDRIAPAAAGILHPSEQMRVAPHVTCLPGELVDPDQEPSLRELAVRGVNTVEQVKANHAIGGKPIPMSRDSQLTFHCSDCGFRSPSTSAMMNHLMNLSHTRAENPLGEVLNPGGQRRATRSV